MLARVRRHPRPVLAGGGGADRRRGRNRRRLLPQHLADLGLLGPRFSGAHGVGLDADDVRRLADAGASVAHNPMSNLRFGNGVAATRLMLDGGLAVGVGTDSPSSADSQN